MKKLTLIATVALSAVLVAGALPASAGKAKIVIEDPVHDANAINDQGTGDGTFGDFDDAGADAGNASDLMEVSLANDAKNLIVTFTAELVPPATQGLGYRLRFNPTGAPGTQCILIEAFWAGATNNMGPAEAKAHLKDTCAGGDPVPLKILGSVVYVPRKAHKAFAKGATLKAPQAQTFVYSGTYPVGVIGPYIDTTKVGADYKMVK